MAAAVAVLAAVPGEWHVTGLVAPTQDSVEVHLRGGATVRFGSGQDAAKKVLVASLDVYRPAAMEQLHQLAKQAEAIETLALLQMIRPAVERNAA